MASLRTDYQDDVFSGERKYRMVNNSDGTVSFIDVTDYTQEGSTFGALDVNATNEVANQVAEDLGDIADASTVTGDDAFSKIATLKTDLGNKATAADVAGANAFAKIHKLNTDLTNVNTHLSGYKYSNGRYVDGYFPSSGSAFTPSASQVEWKWTTGSNGIVYLCAYVDGTWVMALRGFAQIELGETNAVVKKS